MASVALAIMERNKNETLKSALSSTMAFKMIFQDLFKKKCVAFKCVIDSMRKLFLKIHFDDRLFFGQQKMLNCGGTETQLTRFNDVV